MNTLRPSRTFAVLTAALCAAPAVTGADHGTPTAPPTPCIWDSDTLGDELRGIPDAFTLIAGRWHRHDPAYYRARIERLPAHLEEHPEDFAAYDDLAVAYERLQDRSEAIEVMARKKAAIDRFAPEDQSHLYRYHANLGTFYAHSGRFDEALHELARAVEINPGAHFGRERYQIDLIRYIQAARQDPELWTEHDFLSWSGYAFEDVGWRTYITRQGFAAEPPSKDEAEHVVDWQEAWTGVAGMLRFGGIEGAELYRVLGDLASAKRHLNLAWYAYGVAIEKGHPAAARLAQSRASIVEHQRDALQHNGGPARIPDEAAFTEARDNADRWLAAFQRLEREALEDGRDPGNPRVLESLLAAADRKVPSLEHAASAGGGSPAKRWTRGGAPIYDADEQQAAPRSNDAKRRDRAEGEGGVIILPRP